MGNIDDDIIIEVKFDKFACFTIFRVFHFGYGGERHFKRKSYKC